MQFMIPVPMAHVCVTLANFPQVLPPEIEGLHFHTLCEQNADDLLTTWKAFEAKFSKYFAQLKWLNLGGGHHITRSDYDVEALIDLVKYIRATYHVEVYLEPGEAVALNAGYLVTEVLDIVHNGLDILILDASLPAICLTCWRCLTVRLCAAAMRLTKSNINTVYPQ